MNNVNTVNNVDTHQKKSSNFGKLPYILALCTVLNIANPTEVKANNITNESLQNVEVVQNSDIVSSIQRKTWVTLPSMYTQKFINFVSNSKILKDKDARKFTEDFIIKQMQVNRWISKQNQLLFIWDAVYEQITSKNIYTWEDGNSARLADFENVMDRVEQCWKNYNSGFKAYMRQRSADAQQRSADAQQRSADAQQRSADAQQRSADAQQRSADAQQRSADAQQRSADAQQETIRLTKNWLDELIRFYSLYKRDPSSVKHDQLRQSRENAKKIIQNCKKYNINYKSKLSPEVRRFYGID